MLQCAQSRNPYDLAAVTVLTTLAGLIPTLALGHTIEGSDANFVQAIDGPAVAPFIYLGAKHMVTGYDHLLFLIGVIFFLYRPKHVIEYVTLFAVGHSMTLLLGVLADLRVNAYLIDAVIGFVNCVQSLREYGWLQTRIQYGTQYESSGLYLRFISRTGAGNQAAGIYDLGQWPRGQYPEFQSGCGAGADYGAVGGSHRAEHLAKQSQLPTPRLCDQHCAYDRRLHTRQLPVSAPFLLQPAY